MTALPLGMFPTLVDTFGGADALNASRIRNINAETIERLEARVEELRTQLRDES